jgi:PHD/YefM family antitoxin component YafN of YafNO toxin-antitoxin module
MYATYTLNKEELNLEFLEILKKTVTGDHIHISVESYDETEYLLRSPKNKEILLERIKNVEEGKELIQISEDDIKNML